MTVLDQLRQVLIEIAEIPPPLRCTCASNYPDSWPVTACPACDDRDPDTYERWKDRRTRHLCPACYTYIYDTDGDKHCPKCEQLMMPNAPLENTYADLELFRATHS